MPKTPRSPVRPADEGQAIVEAAFAIPAMTFLVLSIMQLTMVQHARIMAEYAAFSAARAGIVFNADKDAMNDAATLALLPTLGLGRTDDLRNFGLAYLKSKTTGRIERSLYFGTKTPFVEITTLSPKKSDFGGALTRHLNNKEIDFDDIRGIANRPNQLQIELKYFYEMRIPYANMILQNIFFAGRTNSLGMWRGPNMLAPSDSNGLPVQTMSKIQYAGSGEDHAAMLVAATFRNRYFFPLKTTYTMRMQSNAFVSNAGD